MHLRQGQCLCAQLRWDWSYFAGIRWIQQLGAAPANDVTVVIQFYQLVESFPILRLRMVGINGRRTVFIPGKLCVTLLSFSPCLFSKLMQRRIYFFADVSHFLSSLVTASFVFSFRRYRASRVYLATRGSVGENMETRERVESSLDVSDGWIVWTSDDWNRAVLFSWIVQWKKSTLTSIRDPLCRGRMNFFRVFSPFLTWSSRHVRPRTYLYYLNSHPTIWQQWNAIIFYLKNDCLL